MHSNTDKPADVTVTLTEPDTAVWFLDTAAGKRLRESYKNRIAESARFGGHRSIAILGFGGELLTRINLEGPNHG